MHTNLSCRFERWRLRQVMSRIQHSSPALDQGAIRTGYLLHTSITLIKIYYQTIRPNTATPTISYQTSHPSFPIYSCLSLATGLSDAARVVAVSNEKHHVGVLLHAVACKLTKEKISFSFFLSHGTRSMLGGRRDSYPPILCRPG
jgi:hypothetical protein